MRELGDLLTTELAERAHTAYVAQGAFREVVHLQAEARPEGSQYGDVAEEQEREARHANSAFRDLLGTRVDWRIDRIGKLHPDAPAIADFRKAASDYLDRTILVRVPPDLDDPTDAAFDEGWSKERDARKALIKQLEVLADLPHPPSHHGGARSEDAGTNCRMTAPASRTPG